MKKFTNKEMNEIFKANESIWRRYGKCKHCGACCRVICGVGFDSMYYQGLMPEEIKGKYGIRKGRTIRYRKIDCVNLTLNNRCKIWAKKGFPSICRKFPMEPIDGVYEIVRKFCGFKFKKVKYGK